MEWLFFIGASTVVGSGSMDRANEVPKGWIFAECGPESVESRFVFDENRLKEIESAAMNPVLAYQSTDAERPEVIRLKYAIVVLISVHTDVINDEKPKLCGKRLFDHVVRSCRSWRTILGSEQ